MLNKKNVSEVKIAISGKSGCGNTTVSGLVANALGLRFINFTFRNLAQERGISLEKVIELAASDDSWDKEVDKRQLAQAREKGPCVIGSRLAVWILKEANLKVYLKASLKERAGRIFKREGGSLKKITEFTKFRDSQDKERYQRIYNIDIDDYSDVDIIIDTSNKTPEKICEIIVNQIKEIMQRFN